MKKYMKIGEMAAMNHVSTQTLRLYAKNKLLEPEYMNPQTGYRYYTLEQCVKLDLIHALQSCRMSLREIKDLLEVDSVEKLADILKTQSGKLEDEIYHLSVSRNNLLRIEKNLRMINALPPFGLPYFEYVEERLIDVQNTPYDFFEQGYSGYEKMIRHMQNYMFSNNLPPSYFVNIGTIIVKADFDRQALSSDKAFVFVDSLYPERDSVRSLPQSLYMSIVSDDSSLEPEYAKVLRQEISRQGMKINGDYICEVLSQFPFKDNGNIYFKIQVPVIRRDVL